MEQDEDELILARSMGDDPITEDARQNLMEEKWMENERLMAVYTAREQRTRITEVVNHGGGKAEPVQYMNGEPEQKRSGR